MSQDASQSDVLTPDDIVNYPLKQAVRGYSVPQVDELLDRVADALERYAGEATEARERLADCEQRLAEASETEATLKRTLVTAQRAAEQSVDEAKQRAAELVDEARREAAGILEQARLDAEELRVEALQAARAEEAEIRRRRHDLEGHVEALRVFERDYRLRLREHLEQQLQNLDELEAQPQAPPPGPDEPRTQAQPPAADEPVARRGGDEVVGGADVSGSAEPEGDVTPAGEVSARPAGERAPAGDAPAATDENGSAAASDRDAGPSESPEPADEVDERRLQLRWHDLDVEGDVVDPGDTAR